MGDRICPSSTMGAWTIPEIETILWMVRKGRPARTTMIEGEPVSNERPNDTPTVSCSREELCIGADEVVFINASPAEVISAETQEAWARLLAAVPGALLAVASFAGREAKEDVVAAFVGGFERVLASHGVDDQRLIVFLKDLPSRADVRSFLQLGNVYLDVHPQSDPQGMADALVAGLPAVSWQGKVSRSRAAAALLRDIKMDELVADTAEELVAKAQRLATDASWRAEVQKRVADAIKAKPRFLDPESGAMDTPGNLESGSSRAACVSVDGTSDDRARTAPTLRRCSGPSAAALSMAPSERTGSESGVMDTHGNLESGSQAPSLESQATSLGPQATSLGPQVSSLKSQAAGLEPQASADDPVWRGKKVMVYTDLPGIYGVGQYNHALLCDLARRGAKALCVQTKDENPLVREREELGVEHVWLSYHTRQEFERTFTDTKDPNRLFKKDRPDLIVFSNCSPRSNLAAKRVAMQRGVPFVIAESYVPAELIPLHPWTRECDSQLATQYRAARQVIAVSQDNLKLLRGQYGMPADKGVVIHYGRPEAYFAPRDEAARKRLRAEFRIPDDAMLCFTAARMDPVKGYQYQLRALGKLKESDIWPKLYFAWAGAGPAEADIKEGVRLLGAENHVRILGERTDVIDWLSAADCFVLTSKAEGMPICIMEAMAKGLPVAATAVSGTPEELGDTGCLLPDPKAASPVDVASALVQALEGWVRDPMQRNVAGERCRVRAEKMFRVERMLEQTRQVMAESISMSAKAGPMGRATC